MTVQTSRHLILVSMTLLLSPGAQAATDGRSVVCETTRVYPDAQTVTFEIEFNRTPDFITTDGFGRPADAFQFLINADADAPPIHSGYADLDVLIRGAEIHTDEECLWVRDAAPPDYDDPDSGGWGPLRGIVSYTLVDTTLTISMEVALIDDDLDGRFTYRLETYRAGSLDDCLETVAIEDDAPIYRRCGPSFNDCNDNDVPDECELAGNDCTSNGIPDECEPDCNSNGIADSCDVAAGSSEDCTDNGIPDECEPDCNDNGIADSCDVAAGSSEDCTSNGIPDECEPDCNGNGIADSCDIAAGSSEDCTGNGIPDECEPDCNGNGIADSCDIAIGISEDCTGNGIPDECEPDCNADGIADSCDIAMGFSLDCNENGVPDGCELAGNDCNRNGVPDECEPDCNTNGVADECDIAAGASIDCNTNGVPDECDLDSRCLPMDLLFSEDFETYVDGEDPADWLDTDTDQGMGEDLFEIEELDDERVLATSSEAVNIHSHYMGPGSAGWATYEYSGRMMVDDTATNSGVTFYSNYPHRDAYYRLRRSGQRGYHISPHSTSITGGDTETGVIPEPWAWYWFRIHVETAATRTEIRAKVWSENEAEPQGWQADCFDDGTNRLTAGTVGVWSASSGGKYWDDLKIRALDCDVDCDSSGELDVCEIADGTSLDCNGNWNPDECDILRWGDFDADNDVDFDDYAALPDCLAGPNVSPNPAAAECTKPCVDAFDFDDDDDVDVRDFARFSVIMPRFESPHVAGDMDGDLDVDGDDFAVFAECISGPNAPHSPDCGAADLEVDYDVDLDDFARFARQFTDPQ